MDIVTLSVLKGRLEEIAEEMDVTLFRSAFNPVIAGARETSASMMMLNCTRASLCRKRPSTI